jgi:hypothetical protein
MKKISGKTRNSAVIVIVIAVIFTVCSWIWLHNGQLDAFQEKIYSVLPFPAALVNGQVVTMRQYILRYELAQKFVAQSGVTDNGNLKHTVFLRLLEESKLFVLARDKNVLPTQSQIDAEYNARLAQTSGGKDLKTILSSYEIGEKTYKDELVKTDVAAANLTTWFFGQKELNSQSYAKADEIMQRLNAGESAADLAKIYSQDPQSQSLGGDEGFLGLADILPEMQAPLKTMRVGDNKIIPTRFGLEVVKLQDLDSKGQNGSARYHFSQIFLAGGDFTAWLNQQTKDYRIAKIANF